MIKVYNSDFCHWICKKLLDQINVLQSLNYLNVYFSFIRIEEDFLATTITIIRLEP